MSDKAISVSQVIAKMTGDPRSDRKIASDGAKVAISQIDKLRRQLDQAERACQHVIATGLPKKDDAQIWRRVSKCAAALLHDMEQPK